MAATQTQSAAIESTHFLMALADVPGSAVNKALPRFGLTAESWKKGLSCWAEHVDAAIPFVDITEVNLHPSALGMLRAGERYCSEYKLPRITDHLLLLCAIENLTDRVQLEFKEAGIDPAAWAQEIKKWVEPPPDFQVFQKEAAEGLIKESFSPSGRRVLSSMQGEAEALGYEIVDSRHLLLALLLVEDGTVAYGLRRQDVQTRKLEEIVTVSLRAKAKKSRSSIALDRAHLQLILQRIFSLAGEIAARDHMDHIDEPRILRAFLKVESTARQMLSDAGANLNGIEETAERREMTEEEDSEQKKDAMAIADIDTVRSRLKSRLVGQNDAIEAILPYIQRMRFGFSVPERPQGVFLFCGPSGTGKTEMAKELARALFGTEENLIYLEMGTFNSPESMNIFVGAPPGYVGYGEGKVTNGLRDKPQSVVLFDEVEKAHPRVLDALLRFLDEGRIDDPAGPVRDGSKCIVVLTSNVGAKELSALWQEVKSDPNWRTTVRKRLRELFEKHNFRVEFLNRVDELILFRGLEADNYAEISKRFLQAHLKQLMEQRQIEVLTDGVYEAIGEYCAGINEGARAARRLGLSVVVTPVIDYVMRSGCATPVKVLVRAKRATDDPNCEPIGIVTSA